ncbi:MAG: hypothetical protein KJ574_03515 [Nanoarchaeota archaeon]|nr:hypothetical protein [Nanoarchaeota archaeon]
MRTRTLKVRTLLVGFTSFLDKDINSTEQFLKEIPSSPELIKELFPVGYFKRDFIRIIKKHHPDRIIVLGMADNIKDMKIETVAKNECLTLKNPVYRFVVTLYSYWLKWQGKNLKIKKPLSKKMLCTVAIDKKAPHKLKLRNTPPKVARLRSPQILVITSAIM